MASVYGKDAYMQQQNDNYYKQNYNPDPPTYNTTTTERVEQNVEVIEEQPIECTPGMCLHPMGLLRWFHLAMFFTLQWLVQITCGGDACTMIMNVFGYTAIGQVFVLIIFLLLSIICAIILLLYSLNGHRALRKMTIAIERVYALLGIVLMLICGALGTWMAVLTRNPEVNYQGRGAGHIRGQWIAAAVLEFLMVPVYIFDLYLQGKENHPYGVKDYQQEVWPTRRDLDREVRVKKVITTTTHEEPYQEEYYSPKNYGVARTSYNQEYEGQRSIL